MIAQIAKTSRVITLDAIYAKLESECTLPESHGQLMVEAIRWAKQADIIQPMTTFVDGLGTIPVFARPKRPSLHGKPTTVYQSRRFGGVKQTPESQTEPVKAGDLVSEMAALLQNM